MELSVNTAVWVSAIAAAVSAFFAAGSFWLYLKELRTKRRAPEPVVEGTAHWDRVAEKNVIFDIEIRNLAPYGVDLTRLSVKRPRGMLLTIAHGSNGFAQPDRAVIQLHPQRILAAGESRTLLADSYASDQLKLKVRCLMPANWPGGEIVLKVLIVERVGNRRRIRKLARADVRGPQPTIQPRTPTVTVPS